VSTFLLGLGAQKCGTSWLHSTIDQSPHTDMGFAKEYHIWDIMTVAGVNQSMERFAKRLRNVVNLPSFRVRKNPNLWLKASFYTDIENYFNYFQCLLLNGEDVRVTGDITPLYSALSRKVIRQIKDGFDRRNITTKVLFSMRDPAQRCFSAAKMAARDQQLQAGEIADGESITEAVSVNAILEQQYLSENYRIRTAYNRTIANIEAVFAQENVFFTFYETMFSQNMVNRLADFLGIDIPPPDFGRRVNESRATERLSEENERRVAEAYRSVYEGVARRFGEATVKEMWPSARFVL
jgi:hypothetical protein